MINRQMHRGDVLTEAGLTSALCPERSPHLHIYQGLCTGELVNLPFKGTRCDGTRKKAKVPLGRALLAPGMSQSRTEGQRVARLTSLTTYLASDYSDQSNHQGIHGRRSTRWRPDLQRL
jgi:hypothetical protein